MSKTYHEVITDYVKELEHAIEVWERVAPDSDGNPTALVHTWKNRVEAMKALLYTSERVVI